jgi:hypothetical protein
MAEQVDMTISKTGIVNSQKRHGETNFTDMDRRESDAFLEIRFSTMRYTALLRDRELCPRN